jgi:hypothetical protein
MTETCMVTIDKNNIEEYPPTCFLNPKNIGHQKKEAWIKKRLDEGLIIKLLYSKKPEKLIGYIEYIPGEFAWRAVHAKNYLLIN